MKQKFVIKIFARPTPCLRHALTIFSNSNQKGYSVLETVIVIVLIGIISGLAAPNMSAMLTSYRLKSAANELSSIMQLAKVTAIAQNANSVVTFNTTNQSYSSFSDNGEGGGTTNDGIQSGTEPTIKTVSVKNIYYNQVTLNAPSFGNSIVFTSQGTCNQSGTVSLHNSSGDSLQILITMAGAIKVVKP